MWKQKGNNKHFSKRAVTRKQKGNNKHFSKRAVTRKQKGNNKHFSKRAVRKKQKGNNICPLSFACKFVFANCLPVTWAAN